MGKATLNTTTGELTLCLPPESVWVLRQHSAQLFVSEIGLVLTPPRGVSAATTESSLEEHGFTSSDHDGQDNIISTHLFQYWNVEVV